MLCSKIVLEEQRRKKFQGSLLQLSLAFVVRFVVEYFPEGFPDPDWRLLRFSHSEERVRSLVQDRDMKTSTLAQETEKFQKLSDNVIKLQVRVRSLGVLLERGFCISQPHTFIGRKIYGSKKYDVCFTAQTL